MHRLLWALIWTFCAFIGGIVAGAPFWEIVIIVAFVAFITGLVHAIAAVVIALKAKY